jgi:hypothetical protein
MKLKQSLALLCILMFSQTVLAETESEWNYPMQPGESVWSIAHELLTDWREWKTIERLNNISNDRQMLPGTVLKIPRSLIKERQSDITILDVSGTVTAQVVMNDGTVKAHLPLVRGQSLGQGDQIKTSPQSSVLLEFDDSTQVLILENSLLKIRQATVVGSKRKVVDIKVFLEEGEAEIRANPAKVPGSQFLIDTPVAFATTKGTTYRVRAQGSSTAAEVVEGKIGVENNLGGTTVNQGYGTLAKADMPPAKPTKLLPAPELPDLSAPIHYLPGKLVWSELKGAAKYRGQISPDKLFTAIVYDSVSDQPKMGLPSSLQDKSYWLRVRAISEEGLQGFSSVQEITIDARPFPPVRQAPRSSDSIYSGEVEFVWSRPELADRFQLDIAKDEHFETLALQESDISDTRFTANIMEPGDYYWRVTSITSQGKVGPLGFAGEFTVKPVPAKPELQAPVSSENEMFFSWNTEPDIKYYQLQFASDQEFNNILVDKNTDKAELAIDKPQPGTYYIRVRAFDADDYAGEWTAPQQVEQPIENWWPLIFSGAATLLLIL